MVLTQNIKGRGYMRKIGFFCYLLLILSVISCQKVKESVVNSDSQGTQIQEISTEPLFHVSEGTYSPEMIYVEGGEYIMGNESVKTNQPHPVKVSSYYIAKYMVTNEIWKKFLEDVKLQFTWDWDDGVGYGPFYNIVPTDDCPAQGLNWYYAVIFCNWASMKDDLEPAYIIDELPDRELQEIKVEWNKDANGYRLPTEAEWEYAARGGNKTEGYIYPGSNNPDEVGRFGKDYTTSYQVGQYKPNELGIHDMGGDADEWCWDWYDKIMFEWLPVENPSVDNSADVKKKSTGGDDLKVRRGTTWEGKAMEIARRGSYPPKNISFTGIRLVRNVETENK